MNNRQKIDRVSIEQRNWRNKEHIKDIREKLAAFDSYKVTNKTDLCGYCATIMRGRIGGAAITNSECSLCKEDMMFSNTCVDVLCSKCALDNRLCKHCGADIELKNRNKPRPFLERQ